MLGRTRHFFLNALRIYFQVKKGLEHLYKKVEKHLCDEENLLQVLFSIITWHVSAFILSVLKYSLK